MIDFRTINLLAEEVEAWAVNLRRDLHKWPEAGNEEYKSKERILYELELMGIEARQVIKTGVTALLNPEKQNKKVIAIRADMDALPMQEETGLEFASQRKGFMHACGHDVHMAVLLGTAKLLNEIRDQVNGAIKFIFQPAEETTGGAERMIKAGCLENPKADCIIGLHVKPELPAGTIGIKYGKVHAASDMFKICVRGQKSHGAYPEQGVDAILAASQIVVNTQSIISRNISPLNSGVISIGSVHGGNAINILADSVVLEGTIRTLDKTSREFLKTRLREVVKATAKAFMATADVEFIKGYSPLINDNLVVDMIKEAAAYGSAVDKVIELKEPSMGVEDFSFFLEKVPGAFFFLGSGYRERENSGIHTSSFDVDEKCIKAGILTETATVLMLLE